MRPLPLLCLGTILAAAGCRYEASFKSLELEGAAYDTVFDTCHDVVVRHYNGIVVRSDRAAGQIETDPVEFNVAKGLRRERVFVHLERRSDERVQVELFAPMYEPRFDPDRPDPYRWRILGSDVQQERRLLEEVLGEVMRRAPQVRVVEG